MEFIGGHWWWLGPLAFLIIGFWTGVVFENRMREP